MGDWWWGKKRGFVYALNSVLNKFALLFPISLSLSWQDQQIVRCVVVVTTLLFPTTQHFSIMHNSKKQQD